MLLLGWVIIRFEDNFKCLPHRGWLRASDGSPARPQGLRAMRISLLHLDLISAINRGIVGNGGSDRLLQLRRRNNFFLGVSHGLEAKSDGLLMLMSLLVAERDLL